MVLCGVFDCQTHSAERPWTQQLASHFDRASISRQQTVDLTVTQYVQQRQWLDSSWTLAVVDDWWDSCCHVGLSPLPGHSQNLLWNPTGLFPTDESAERKRVEIRKRHVLSLSPSGLTAALLPAAGGPVLLSEPLILASRHIKRRIKSTGSRRRCKAASSGEGKWQGARFFVVVAVSYDDIQTLL